MRLPSLVFLASLASTATAHVTGGFGYAVDDDNLKLEVESAFGHGNGAPLLNFRGQFTLPPAIAPKGLERVALDRANLPQEIVIMTKAGDDDIAYVGEYEMRLFAAAGEGEATERRGKVSCSVG
ncbi:hypothetical protein J2Y48_001551 [Mycoplana sp. BE70]|uniref:hypothetical protein n=1 Tax=Mycoplana sp. BE70 TaxID=2817775 RepID=UPI0028679D2F|nr:hypothetical protein [Mycoplana sp. BE70]MDR6756261.1 hypothetical protein [Mycoplana sp. BE70]